MDSGFCVDYLEEALQNYGTPEIFNTDQGSQFTSKAFTGVLLKKCIAISMDGRDRALERYCHYKFHQECNTTLGHKNGDITSHYFCA